MGWAMLNMRQGLFKSDAKPAEEAVKWNYKQKPLNCQRIGRIKENVLEAS